MKKIVDIIIGYFVITVESVYPERVLNYCGINGIDMWDIQKSSANRITARISRKGYVNLMKGAENAGFIVRIEKREGLPFFLLGFKKRYALLLTAVILMSLLWISSLFIWEIRISGNEAVPTEEILAALDKYGVCIGANRVTLPTETLSNDVLIDIPELSFITVNTVGSVAHVIVREKIPEPKLESKAPSDIVASKSGIITKLTVTEGRAVVSKGATVEKGDTLVSGEEKHARAEVYARTWYDFSVVTPKEYVEKEYTGQETKKYSVIFGRTRVNLYLNSGISYASYDKINKSIKLGVGGLFTLPVAVVCETYREYVPEISELSQAELSTEMTEKTLNKLTKAMDSGVIINSDYSFSEDDKNLILRITCECSQQIGAEK